MSKKMSLSESCRVILSSGKDAVDNLFKNKKQKPIKRSKKKNGRRKRK